jgi:hypothetical protein
MNLLHVFDGLTDADEYYWFVLAELDNADELILTMPKARVSDGIRAQFEAIADAYQTARAADQNSQPDLVAMKVGDSFGFKRRTTVDRDG